MCVCVYGVEKRMRNREETFFRCLLDNAFTYHIVEGAYKWDPTYDSETRMTIYEIRKKPEVVEDAKVEVEAVQEKPQEPTSS